MSTATRLITLAATALCFVAVLPSASAKAAEPKVAYVNMAEALNKVNDGKKAKSNLKKEHAKQQAKLNKMQEGLKAKKDQFDARRKMMKAEAIMAKQEELQREYVELQQTYMKLQQELAQKEAKLTQGIAAKIRTIVGRIGDREQYAMILDIGDSVLYYKRHQDITEKVVAEYNKTYK